MIPAPFDIKGVVNLSDVMTHFLGITDPMEQDDFTDDISGVTWGDAHLTLVTVKKFWAHFIDPRGSNPYNPLNRVYQAWANMDTFVNAMEAHGYKYINLEG